MYKHEWSIIRYYANVTKEDSEIPAEKKTHKI